MLELISESGRHYVKGYDELLEFMDETEFLKLFLSENDMLIFGCIWHESLIDNIKNIRDPYQQKIYQELSEFFIQDVSLLEQDDNIKDFIEQKTILINKEWLLPYPKPEDVDDIRWLLPNDDEVRRAIYINQNYTCVILEKGKDFKHYKCVIHCYEDDDGKSLLIVNKKESHFFECVVPVIQQIINKIEYM